MTAHERDYYPTVTVKLTHYLVMNDLPRLGKHTILINLLQVRLLKTIYSPEKKWLRCQALSICSPRGPQCKLSEFLQKTRREEKL